MSEPAGGTIKKLGQLFGKGLLLQTAPGVAQQVIRDLFREWDVTTALIREYVRTDISLADRITPIQREEMRAVQRLIGNLDFLTPDLVLKAIEKDFTGPASLFLSSPSAMQWLVRQIDGIKDQISSANT